MTAATKIATEVDEDDSIESVLATLQPLRDLAKNWDIDIASCLEDYLNDLVGGMAPMSPNVRESSGGTMLNFAQAALVLQNSSNIYSRKVEYLYSLVFKSLEDSFLQGQNNNAKGTRQRHTDPDIDEFLAYDPNQEFLLLDDVLPVDDSPDNRKIDLAESEPTAGVTTPGKTYTRLSITENKSVTAINEVAYRTLLDPEGCSLRLFKASVSEDGWLRLPGTNQSNRNKRRQSEPLSGVATPIDEHGAESSHMDDGEDDNHFAPDSGGFDDDVDDDDDGPGFNMADDENNEMISGETEDNTNDPPKRVTFAETNATPQKADPWALLDPYAVDTSAKPKPLRIGKTVRLPKGLKDLPSACVTGARTKRAPTIVPTVETEQEEQPRFHSTSTFQGILRKRPLHDDDDINSGGSNSFRQGQGAGEPEISLTKLAFGDEFSYIARASAKRAAAARRLARLKEQESSTSTPAHATTNYQPFDDDDDDEFGGNFDYGDDNDINSVGGNDASVEGNTGMVSLDDVYNGGSNNDDVPRGDTFEELCQAHLQAFAKRAERYASETKLTQRVDKWQERLRPLLDDEENRPVFDIHEYGDQILETMKDQIHRRSSIDGNLEKPSKTVSFAEVTRHSESYDVCRKFLACLCLTNAGSISLADNGDDCDTLNLELINGNMEHPVETYQNADTSMES